MNKLTDAFRLFAAVLMGASAGLSLATAIRVHLRELAQEERDGIDIKIEDVLKATTRMKAE